jgi:hypothetical protein
VKTHSIDNYCTIQALAKKIERISFWVEEASFGEAKGGGYGGYIGEYKGG